MLMENVTARDLWLMLEPHMHRPAWPGLCDPRVKKRAQKYARATGQWDRLTEAFGQLGKEGVPVIPAINYSVDQLYDRTGDRQAYGRVVGKRRDRTILASLALWLGHPAASARYLEDLLWAWCESTHWFFPAHAGRDLVDLQTSGLGRTLAEIVWMLDKELDAEVRRKVTEEIEKRLFGAMADWTSPPWWLTVRMNWSHVCLSNLIAAALYLIRSPEALAAYVHPLCLYLDYGLQGFADDGGCLEGPSYWNYGFGHFLDAAIVMQHRTGGKLNLAKMAEEKIERICRYPLAVHIAGTRLANYSDSHEGYFVAENMLKVNRFFRMPELLDLADRGRDGTLRVEGWRALALYEGEKAGKPGDDRDYLLPETGYVKFHASSHKSTVLAALAGANWWPHNHNDIGSFILHTKEFTPLVDPGLATYTRKTFGPDRFDILFIGSQGHSVPVINGRFQHGIENGDYHKGVHPTGTLEVEGVNCKGTKRAVIEMADAYPDPTLKSLLRKLRLDPDGTLHISDNFTFSRKPRSVAETFVTYSPVRVAGKAVHIGKGKRTVVLRATGAAGRFKTERFPEISRESGASETLSRITFTPVALGSSVQLAFTVQ